MGQTKLKKGQTKLKLLIKQKKCCFFFGESFVQVAAL